MKIYEVSASELIWEVGYVKANSPEEAKKIAEEDWRVEWHSFDGENFKIDEIREVPEEEAKLIEEDGYVATLDNSLEL